MEGGQTQPKKDRFAVGVDAGGTTIRLALVSVTTGHILAEVQGGAAPDGGPEPVSELLRKALKSTTSPAASVEAVCAGITKFTRTGVRQRWEAELHDLLPHVPEPCCLTVPNFVVALHGAVPRGVGIGVVAGTGSVVYGEDGTGGAVRVGGRGWEYGDEGSGAWMTAEAVRRTLRALDGLEKSTPLNDAVCSFLETQDPAVLAEAVRRRAEDDGRAFLVPLVLEAARGGDDEAANLYVGAAGWLAAQARAVYSRLAFGESEVVPLATIGGMWEAGDLLLAPFRQLVERWMPSAAIIAPDGKPVMGAVRMARRTLTTPPAAP